MTDKLSRVSMLLVWGVIDSFFFVCVCVCVCVCQCVCEYVSLRLCPCLAIYNIRLTYYINEHAYVYITYWHDYVHADGAQKRERSTQS